MQRNRHKPAGSRGSRAARMIPLWALAALLAVVLAGCGTSSGGGGSASEGEASAEAAPSLEVGHEAGRKKAEAAAEARAEAEAQKSDAVLRQRAAAAAAAAGTSAKSGKGKRGSGKTKSGSKSRKSSRFQEVKEIRRIVLEQHVLGDGSTQAVRKGRSRRRTSVQEARKGRRQISPPLLPPSPEPASR